MKKKLLPLVWCFAIVHAHVFYCATSVAFTPAPSSLDLTLGAGEVAVRGITVTNNGTERLEWEAEAVQEEALSEAVPWLLASGGDTFGYRWADNRDANGPDFAWEDIRDEGTPIFLADDESLLIPLPFRFVFYGMEYETVRVSSNGYLTFGEDGSDHTSDPIPSETEPNALIAAYWRDLDPSLGGEIHTFHDEEGERLLVQYTDIQPFGGGTAQRFQIILHRSGDIVLQYQNQAVIEVANSQYSIGIENEEGTIGSSVAGAAGDPDSGLAVRFYSPTWLSVQPAKGSLAAGDSAEISVTVNSGALFEGTYEGAINLTRSDGPSASVPVTLQVEGRPLLESSPERLLFEPVGVGAGSEEYFVVKNAGSALLELSGFSFSEPEFSTSMAFPRTVEPGEEIRIPVRAAPTEVGVLTGLATLSSNDPGAPVVTVPLEAEGTAPADIAVDTSPRSLSLPAGDRIEIPLQITNSGIAHLEWSVILEGDVPELPTEAEPAAASGDVGVADLDRPHATDRVIVRFNEDMADPLSVGSPGQIDPRERLAVGAGAGKRAALPNIPAMEIWELNEQAAAIPQNYSSGGKPEPKERLRTLLAWLNAQPEIDYAEPDYRIQLDPEPEMPILESGNNEGPGVFPDDPRFGLLWGLHNTGQEGGLVDADIDAPEAWLRHTGAEEIVVAVIDTGVDYTHPDLAGNIWINKDEIPGNGLDDDGNGYVDDVYGWDWANGDRDPMDDHYHGTHCAGTVAAVGDNGEGVVGVAWKARIMSLKFLDSSGSGYLSDAILAIDYATANGARITSNSWGGGGYSQAMVDAIEAANEANVLFVAAAGNDSRDADASPAYPAAYDLPSILSVAATNRLDELASFSNYGSDSVDLGAPGSTILSTVPGGYNYLSGTSMATPHVTGAAAMVLAKNPLLSAKQVKDILLEAVDPVGDLIGKTVTEGRLNLRNSLDLAAPPWLSLTPGEGRIEPGETVEVTLELNADFLPTGTLEGTLAFSSNDPDTPILEIPIELTVTSAPALRVMENPIVFTEVFHGGTTTREVVIANTGTEPLTVGGFATEGPFSIAVEVPMVLAPGEREVVQITARGEHPGRRTGQLIVQSDDPTDPESVVLLESNCIEPPVWEALPDRIDHELVAGGSETTSIELANTGSHSLNFSVLDELPGWLRAGPEEGTVEPGEVGLLELEVDTDGLGSGRYAHLVSVESNDPQRSREEILMVLDVTDGPLLAMEPGEIDFSIVYEGYPQNRDIELRNDGNEPLLIDSMEISDSAFRISGTRADELAPGAVTTLTIEADAAVTGEQNAFLSIKTNEEGIDARTLSLRMDGRPAPVLQTDATAYSFDLSSGETSSEFLTLHNAGDEPLEVTAAVEAGGDDVPFGKILQTFHLFDIINDGAISAAAYLENRFYIASANYGPNRPLVHVLDAEGNLLRNFPQPEVPGGNWGIIDFATDGEFLYAGTHRRILQMDTAGNLIRSIPKPEELAGVYGLARDPANGNLWVNGNDGDLLKLDEDGVVLERFEHNLEGLFGMAWDTASPEGPFLWIAEIKELQTRRIHQFDPVAGRFTGLAFTVNPATGWSGGLSLTTSWEEGSVTLLAVTQGQIDYLHMVNLNRFQDWLDLETYAATVLPGETVDLVLRVNPGNINGGFHSAVIRVNSNDPATPEIVLPVELSFTGTPLIELPSPEAVLFEEPVFVGGRGRETMRIRNGGTDVLAIESLSVTGSGFLAEETTPFALDPQESRELVLWYEPETAGTGSGSLTLHSNASARPVIEVPLEAEAIPAPVIDMDDSPLAITLYAGEERDMEFPVGNLGEGVLRWQADARKSLSDTSAASPGSLNLFPGEDKALTMGSTGTAAVDPEVKIKSLPWSDGFESGRWSDEWFAAHGTGKTEITDNTSGEGKYSLHHYGQTTDGHFRGVYQLFEPAQPDYFAFRVRGSTFAEGHAYVTLGNRTNDHIIWFFNTGTGFWSQTEFPSGHASLAAEPDRWYHIECRDIDWQAKTFDYFVDGELLQENVGFRKDSVESIERLDLYNFNEETEAWWDDIRLGEQTAPWLRFSSSAGEIVGGESGTLTVTVSADYREPGLHEGWLVIENTDPSSGEIIIPVKMTVMPGAAPHFPRERIGFGEVVIDGVAEDTLVVANSGSEPLNISGIEVDDPAFATTTAFPITIAPGERQILDITFTPSEAGAHRGELVLHSNSPFATVPVVLEGDGVEPPGLDVDTAPLVVEVPAGQSISGALELRNAGVGQLDVTASFLTEARLGGPVSGFEIESFRTGGPDNFGYVFTDEREDPGSYFQWEEIAVPEGGAGTELSSLTGLQYSSDTRDNDDAYVYPVDLPFPFPFYGTSYEQVAVGAYGVVYFEDDGFGWYMTELPTDNLSTDRGTNRFIATYNDHLDIVPGAVYVHGNEDRFIIEHYKVRSNFAESATFQTILYPNGDIRMQWKETGPWLTGVRATIGIQGDTTSALQYGRWAGNLVEPGRSIYYTYPGNGFRDWLRGDGGFTLSRDGEAVLSYEIDASPLLPGEYEGRIVLRSNDPGKPVTEIPLHLTVTDPAAEGLSLVRLNSGLVVEGDCLVLGEDLLLAASPVGEAEEVFYTVTSTGNGVIEVDGTSSTSFSQADIAGGAVRYCHDGSDTETTTEIRFTVADAVESIGPFGLNLAVSAVNDPPILTGPDHFIAVSGMEENLFGMTLDDPDISHRYADWFLSLKVEHGTLFMEGLPGGVYFGGTGGVQNNDTSHVTVETWLSRLQTNFQSKGGIRYTPAAGFTGEDTLQVEVRDNGNTGYGPEGITTMEIPITVYGSDMERWRHRHFSPADLADPNREEDLWGDRANPDGDPWDNLTEYFLFLDPLESEGDPLRVEFDGVHIRLRFPVRSATPELEWSAVWSRSPAGPWSGSGVLIEILEDHGDWQLLEARIPFVDGRGKFFRLEVESRP